MTTVVISDSESLDDILQNVQSYYDDADNKGGDTNISHMLGGCRAAADDNSQLWDTGNFVTKCGACGADDGMSVSNRDILMRCKICNMVNTFIHSADLSTSEKTDIKLYISKKSNCFMTWLYDIKGIKNTKIIPDNVLSIVNSELNNSNVITETGNIRNKHIKVTNGMVRSILKKHKLTKYYGDIPNIIKFITQDRYPTIEITEEEEYKFKCIIGVLTRSYEDYRDKMSECSAKLTSYNFLIKKIAEIIGNDTIANDIVDIKNTMRRNEYELLWKFISTDVGLINSQ